MLDRRLFLFLPPFFRPSLFTLSLLAPSPVLVLRVNALSPTGRPDRSVDTNFPIVNLNDNNENSDDDDDDHDHYQDDDYDDDTMTTMTMTVP